MNFKNRIEKIEKKQGTNNKVFIWMEAGETQEEALKRSGRKTDPTDEVFYLKWRD